ncbi:hypothetical protein NHX12_023585 [Muraenolepis orangiensis]|uniref:Uncharacterized protein n=1 Tax=Muraenolepis orangiensis TaxID=630683 RepID=A0A9Q0ISW5_9TELE|nr:hypothetical protein NHX12_023585 [Muraenolepis orangiensis]
MADGIDMMICVVFVSVKSDPDVCSWIHGEQGMEHHDNIRIHSVYQAGPAIIPFVKAEGLSVSPTAPPRTLHQIIILLMSLVYRLRENGRGQAFHVPDVDRNPSCIVKGEEPWDKGLQ